MVQLYDEWLRDIFFKGNLSTCHTHSTASPGSYSSQVKVQPFYGELGFFLHYLLDSGYRNTTQLEQQVRNVLFLVSNSINETINGSTSPCCLFILLFIVYSVPVYIVSNMIIITY